jgi:hypothetical protein
MISYQSVSSNSTSVKLDGKLVGFIMKEGEGYRYYPSNKGKLSNGGELFPNMNDVKKSLEEK